MAIVFWSQSTLSLPGSQVSMDISAESLAKIALYYQNTPLKGNEFDFSLPINASTGKFEKTSDLFHLVGNIEQAEIIFAERDFILNKTDDGGGVINLTGNFIFDKKPYSVTQKLRIPVLEQISRATSANGFRINFSSQLLAEKYSQGRYANTFTLLITPVS